MQAHLAMPTPKRPTLAGGHYRDNAARRLIIGHTLGPIYNDHIVKGEKPADFPYKR